MGLFPALLTVSDLAEDYKPRGGACDDSGLFRGGAAANMGLEVCNENSASRLNGSCDIWAPTLSFNLKEVKSETREIEVNIRMLRLTCLFLPFVALGGLLDSEVS